MMTTRFRSRWGASTTAFASSGRVSAKVALIGSPRWCSLSLTASAYFCRERSLSALAIRVRYGIPALEKSPFCSARACLVGDCAERIWPHRDQEHREAQGSHDERDHAQHFFHGRP